MWVRVGGWVGVCVRVKRMRHSLVVSNDGSEGKHSVEGVRTHFRDGEFVVIPIGVTAVSMRHGESLCLLRRRRRVRCAVVFFAFGLAVFFLVPLSSLSLAAAFFLLHTLTAALPTAGDADEDEVGKSLVGHTEGFGLLAFQSG